MAANVTPNLTNFALGATGDVGTWAGASGAIDTEVFKQGTSSWYYQTPKNGVGDGNFTPTASIDMSAADTHLYWWQKCDVFNFCELLNTGATASGLMCKIESSATDYVTWHIAGSDTWGGEWKAFTIDVNNTANTFAVVGTLNLAAVTKISWLTDNSNSGNIRIVDNTNLDAIRFGTGLTIDGTLWNLADVAAEDNLVANKWGILENIEGVIFSQGRLNVGNGATTTTFNSTNEVLVFRDAIVSAALYELAFAGSGLVATVESFTARASGTTDTTRFYLDASDSTADVTITASAITRAGLIDFSSTTDISTTVYNNCQLISPSTGIFANNTILNCLATRAVKVVASHQISNCIFTDNVNATWYDTIGTYSDTGNTYTGNTFDVENSSAGLVTINAGGGSNVSTNTNTGGGSVTINNNISITFSGLRDNTEIRIYTAGTTTELAGVENATAGTIDDRSFTASIAAATSVDYRIHNVTYVTIENYAFTWPSSDQNLPVAQQFDRVFLNP